MKVFKAEMSCVCFAVAKTFSYMWCSDEPVHNMTFCEWYAPRVVASLWDNIIAFGFGMFLSLSICWRSPLRSKCPDYFCHLFYVICSKAFSFMFLHQLPSCTCQLLLISPHVAIECGDPGTPRNGSRQLSGQTAGSIVIYRCDTGFELMGTRTQRCMDSGDWSDQLPECRGK